MWWDKILEKRTERLISGVNKFKKEHLKNKLKIKMGLLQKQFQKPILYNYLEYKYADYPILKRGGEVFPVVTFPQDKLQPKLGSQYESEAGLQKKGEIDSTEYRKFKESYDEKVSGIDVEKNKEEFAEVRTYTMLEFNENKGILQCGAGQYEDTLDSCEALGYELLCILAKGSTDFKKIDKKTKLRNKLHSLVPDPIRSGKERVCGLGISALLVYREEVKLKMFIMDRGSTTVGLHENLLHVIPSGMFQKLYNFKDDFNDIKENLYKEYAEELFGISHKPKKGKGRPISIHQDNESKEPIADLKRSIIKGEASLEITGLAVDLLSLRPEICMLLYIKSPDWWEKHRNHIETNQEAKQVRRVTYSNNENELLKEICPDKTIPAGAAAFWLGIDKLRKIL